MGFIKTAMYATLCLSLFYGGMQIQKRWYEHKLSELESKLTEVQTIDYKVRSLTKDYVDHPEEVEMALKQYQEYLR